MRSQDKPNKQNPERQNEGYTTPKPWLPDEQRGYTPPKPNPDRLIISTPKEPNTTPPKESNSTPPAKK